MVITVIRFKEHKRGIYNINRTLPRRIEAKISDKFKVRHIFAAILHNISLTKNKWEYV